MDALVHDIRLAVRTLRRSPGFTAIAALCIAIGIAANVFIWTPTNALLLRPLPFPASEAVMHVSMWRTDGARRTYGSWSAPDYEDLARLPGVFASVGAHTEETWNVGGVEEPERILGARVTPSLFPTLGLQPALGRFFRPDDATSETKVVVIGSGVWERKFAADSGVIGRTLTLDGAPYTIVGVMARGVRFPETHDLWIPFVAGEARAHRDMRMLQVTGRLAPGVSREQADARVAALMRANAERFADTNEGWSSWLVPMNDLIAREVRPLFLIMLGAVGFVLLIACANVANLLLARGAGRQREVTVRLSLGAPRHRIVRQFLTESLLLASLGGAAGILLGTWATEWFTTRMMPTTVPYWMRFDVDRFVVLVTVAITMLSGLTFGILPALSLSSPSLGETLKDAGGRGSSAASRVGRTRSTLVVAELALSLVLLVGAGLMMRSFMATMTADLGFEGRGLLNFELSLSGERYASDSMRTAFLRLLEERLRAVPSVTAVGLIDDQLVADCCKHVAYFPAGKEYPRQSGPHAWFARISPDYLATMRIPLRQGRGISAADAATGERVALVDDVFAQREWPNGDALGKRVQLQPAGGDAYTVVGVFPHLVTRSVTDDRSAEILLPLGADYRGERWVVVRTSGEPSALLPAVRSVVHALDPSLPIAHASTMDFILRDRMFQPRVFGSMFAIFAGAALLLASIGLYGVMSYLVAQRTPELGIRMALGASARDVRRLVMRGALRLIGGGLLIGVPAALVLAQLLRGALFGVSATDPVTMVGIPLLLTAIALLASAVPARRATRVDPLTALRHE
ncbi:MAG: ABC transporter permease [Gemmatimonadota bacterium]